MNKVLLFWLFDWWKGVGSETPLPFVFYYDDEVEADPLHYFDDGVVSTHVLYFDN
jgi:hypothetical protein